METITKNAIKPSLFFSACTIMLTASAPAQTAIIINEIDYDQAGSDIAEFIELYNTSPGPVSLSGYSIDLVNGSSGSTYNSFDLNSHSIDANGYLVLCGDATTVANCTINLASSSWLQNGGSDGDAIALLREGTLVDSVVYEGIGNHLASLAEGGSFASADSSSITASIARLPNGTDTDFNAGDFGSACLTPGGSNIGGSGDCSIPVNPVPVPAAAWLFGSGLIGLIGISRRNRHHLPA